MKNSILLLLCVLSASCCCETQTPRAEHVILIGLDAMGAYGVQRAETPTMNYIVENGASSFNTRCIRTTSSSQNWMSMVSGALPEQHGVTDNSWQRDNVIIPPSLKNKLGLFPTIFDHVREQRPEAKIYMYYEWKTQDRMYDVSVADRAVKGLDTEQTLRQAIDAFFEDKPELMFISLNEPDHVGHEFGHESTEYLAMITRLDAIIGELVARLEKEGMTKNTVLLVTADHGGIGNSHGGDSQYERLVPMFFYGKGVTPNKVMEPAFLICDVAATVGGLLGVKLPRECAGQFVMDAFTPRTNDKQYVPVPYLMPSNGFFREATQIAIRGDVADAQVYYTIDGSTPNESSTRYESPFVLDRSALVRAAVCRHGQWGEEAVGMIRVLPQGAQPKVSYRMWDNYMGKSLPNFRTLGTPSRSGRVHEFSLDELNVTKSDHFAIEFTAKLEIERAGLYKFGIISDDGSKLIIDGRQVIDNDGSHTADVKYGSVELTAGVHDVRIEYFDDYMGQRLELYYSTEGIVHQIVPFARFK